MKKYVIAFLIWVMIIPVAILNGGFREYVLMEHLEMLALPLSGIILSVCIFLVAYLFVPKYQRVCKTRLHFIWCDVVCFNELI